MKGKRNSGKKCGHIIDRVVVCLVEPLEHRRLLSATTIYVDQNSPGLNNGSSWVNAYTSLQSGLSAAQAIETSASGTAIIIEVGQGTYLPTAGTQRNATFQLIDNVALEGGFAGYGATNPDLQSPSAYLTYLSGNIGTGGDIDNDSYSVVSGVGTNSTAAIGGFTITAGNANDPNGIDVAGGGIDVGSGTPAISNCSFTNNLGFYGGAIGIASGSFSSGGPAITDCIFTGNFGGQGLNAGGGAIYDSLSSPLIVNCLFTANQSSNYGGAIDNANAAATITNCTFSGNSAATGAAVADLFSRGSTITNSILWGDEGGAEIADEYGAASNVNYSDVDGGTAGSHDLNTSPLFVSTSNFALQSTSLCIDVGNNAAVPSNDTTDLAGNPRISNSIVDLGAYEYQKAQPIVGPTIYVDASAAGSNTGVSWANAFTNLQSALAVATGIQTIEVGQGTYYPTTGTNRSATFQLIDGIAVEGGFAGVGTTNPDARNVSAYPTILSGDIGTPGVTSDNCYSVVTAGGTNHTALIDGFTITGGNADGSTGESFNGGGLNSDKGTPDISHCTFINNYGLYGGGMIVGPASPNYVNAGPLVTDCAFIDNSSGSSGEAGGGAAFIDYCSPTFINCVFNGNSAATYGGALNDPYSAPSIINCTFSNNSASTGSAIVDAYQNGAVLSNCILWGDTGGSEISNLGGGTTEVTYSDVQGAYAGTGNINQNPNFLSSSNLELQSSSNCINAGSTGAVPTGVTTDLAGIPRVLGSSVDMGAYEAVPGVVAGAGALFSLSSSSTGQITFSVTGGSISLTSDISASLGNYILSVGNGGTVSLAAGQNVGAIQLLGTGTLDIQTHSLTINYGAGNPSPLATVQQYLTWGYNGGTWNGTGILSSTAAANSADSVGYADGGVDAGTPAGPGQILIRYTLAGDANLDGKVDFDDLGIVGQHLNTLGNDWAQGNFDYAANGLVNFTDLGIVGQNLNKLLTPAAGSAEEVGGTTVGLTPNAGATVAAEDSGAGSVDVAADEVNSPTAAAVNPYETSAQPVSALVSAQTTDVDEDILQSDASLLE